MWRKFVVLLVCALATGCLLPATAYKPWGQGGGYSEEELEPGIWRVRFKGNSQTNFTTVQTYWLYRYAEIALAQGFEGFEVLTIFREVEG